MTAKKVNAKPGRAKRKQREDDISEVRLEGDSIGGKKVKLA